MLELPIEVDIERYTTRTRSSEDGTDRSNVRLLPVQSADATPSDRLIRQLLLLGEPTRVGPNLERAVFGLN
jgi:hypothetical protein